MLSVAKRNKYRIQYSNKTNNSNQRGIPFELSIDEFIRLKEKATTCDYTGEVFTVDNPPTIERIDDRQGYTVDNCCMVTKRANQLKAQYLENAAKWKGSKNPKVYKDLVILNKVKDTLKNKTKEQLVSKYKIAEVTKMTTPTKTTNPTPTDDVNIAKGYIDWVGEDATRSKVSLVAYRKQIKRKTCAVSGVPLSKKDWYHEGVLIRLDKEKPYTDKNIAMVANITKGVLEAKVSNSSLKRIINSK